MPPAPGTDADDARLLAAEHRVEERSAELKKELRLRDVVLSQIIYIVGLTWPGTAAKLGPSHVMYWVPAVLLFYVPSGMVVIHLNREMPLEGGLYQWAKLRFGELTGFLVALNLWSSLVLGLASFGSQVTVALSYAGGASTAWIADSKPITLAFSVLVLGGMTAAAIRGLSVAKWIHNAGSYSLFVLFGAMTLFALPRWLHGTGVTAPLAFAPPAVTLLNVNLLGKMGFGAFCGFDGAAVFAGEVRDPDVARTIRRSVWVSGPLIMLAYVLGTASVLAFTGPADVDLVAPTVQALSRGARTVGIAALATPVVVALTLVSQVGNGSFAFNAGVRLPMVAGWDYLLPGWLSRLHPRFKTPVGSTLLIAIAAFVLTVLANLNVGAQEAFQLAFSGNLTCWGIAYLVMFAIPVVGPGERAPLKLRIAAISGFVMTLLFVVLSIFPVVDVANVASFAMKLGGLVVAINVAGAIHFVRVTRARERAARARR